MARGIRQNDNIVGIQLTAIERPLTVKINQFVDDTQLFARNGHRFPIFSMNYRTTKKVQAPK